MEKTFNFGKIAYSSSVGNKINKVEVTIELQQKPNKDTVFSAHALIWNSTCTHILEGGQCLDTINEYPTIHNNETFAVIYKMWKKYHLNDMHAGTERQETALKEAIKNGKLPKHSDYTEQCEYLKTINLLDDEEYLVPKQQRDGSVEHVPYRYGSGWLYREIPEADLEIIRNLIQS